MASLGKHRLAGRGRLVVAQVLRVEGGWGNVRKREKEQVYVGLGRPWQRKEGADNTVGDVKGV